MAPLWLYLHPKDQVDFTNTLFSLDTYRTALCDLHKPTRLFNKEAIWKRPYLTASERPRMCASVNVQHDNKSAVMQWYLELN